MIVLEDLAHLPEPLENMVMIDIREPNEYAREHIPNSQNIPVDKLEKLPKNRWQNQTVLFYCKAGMRTQQAQSIINNLDVKTAYCLAGGMEQWKKQGKITLKNIKAPLELMRQVQLIAGSLIILTSLLGYLVSVNFLFFTLLIGLGLFTAGLTGFCGLAKLLMRLPYNHTQSELN